MRLLFFFLIAFAPGAFLLWIIYERDKCEKEPFGMIIRTFLLGIVIAVPVSIIEFLMMPGFSATGVPESVGAAAYAAFVVAGVTEEVGKFLVLALTVYSSRHFNEPIDGLVYASAVALGFASIENLGYVLQFGPEVMIFRAPLATVAHVIFASFWGYALALKKLNHEFFRGEVIAGLLLAIIVHGVFDFVLFLGGALAFTVIFLLIGGIILFALMIVHARRISPFCHPELPR